MSEMNLGWLHLFGQIIWHDDAYIVGDRAGIEMLRDALTAALDDPQGVSMCADVFTNDGEGYGVSIHVLPAGEMDRLAVPYTDGLARAPVNSMWPWTLPVKPRHPRDGGSDGG